MKPSLHLGPVCITREPSPKSAAEPRGLVNTLLAARGAVLVRNVRDTVEMLRNEADFLKAAVTRGLERVSRTGLEQCGTDTNEAMGAAMDAASLRQLAETQEWLLKRVKNGVTRTPFASELRDIAAADRGPEAQYVEPGLPGDANAPFKVTNGDNYDNSFARKYAASLQVRQCLASGCTTRFSSGDSARLLCNIHAQKAGRL